MKDFKANGKTYYLDKDLRNTIKSDWREMLKPAKSRVDTLDPMIHLPMLANAENILFNAGENLVGKNILEVGCSFGNRSFLMAKYEGTTVHGIDVDEYTLNQSPDTNVWNPKDMEYMKDRVAKFREKLFAAFPPAISSKVSFSTESIETFASPEKFDVIISFDVLEHILDLDAGFRQMAANIKPGGIMFHEYNPFFSLDGGHSLCTLDFQYGHCVLSKDDFERYIKTIRPAEEKIAINFYNNCLNRATRTDIKTLIKKYGFELLSEVGHSPFVASEAEIHYELSNTVLPDVKRLYPTVEAEDLIFNSVQLILRKL